MHKKYSKLDALSLGAIPASLIAVQSLNNMQQTTSAENLPIQQSTNEQSNQDSYIINYVYNGHILSSQTFTGNKNTSQNISLADLHLPNGYQIVNNTEYPTKIAFGLENNTFNVSIEPRLSYLGQDTKTITRKIILKVPGLPDQVQEQKVIFSRSKYQNEVTKEINYGNWNTSASFPEYEVPAIDGYETTQKRVPAKNVNYLDSDSETIVNYIPKENTFTVNYVDQDGKIVLSDTYTGKTGEKKTLNLHRPVGWTWSNGDRGQVSLTFGPHMQPLNITVKHQLATAAKKVSITRKIYAVDETGKKISENPILTQTAQSTQHNEIDMVTGKTVKARQEPVHFEEASAPEIAGYTALQNVSATAADKDIEQNLVYRKNGSTKKQALEIKFIDNSDHNKIIGTQIITGNPEETVNIQLKVPDNWTAVGQVPSTIKFGNGMPSPIEVYIKHKQEQIYSDNDRKQVTRRVFAALENGTRISNNPIITQTATLNRQSTKDLVTGQIDYGSWNKSEWSAATPPNIPGYTLISSNIAQKTVDSTTNNTDINAIYKPIQHSFTIHYIAPNNKEIGTQIVSGLTNEKIHIAYNVPANYKLSIQQLLDTVTFGADNLPDINVKVEPNSDSIKDITDSPTYFNQAHKTITRKIVAHINSSTQILHTDSATFNRKIFQNTSLNTIQYGDWSGEQTFNSYQIPEIKGYTSNIKTVNSKTVTTNDKDETIDIYYTPIQSAIKLEIQYQYQNKIVGSQTINGTADETEKIDLNIPQGYKIKSGSKIPNSITFGSDIKPIIISVEPNMTEIKKETKTITRKVYAKDENNNLISNNPIITQTATITRLVYQNNVTGEISYGDWTTATLSAASLPGLPGYKTDIKQVDSKTINGNSNDENISVTYDSLEHQMKIAFITADKKIIKTDVIKGKTGQTISVNYQVPEGYSIVNGQKLISTITFGDQDIAEQQVLVEKDNNTPSKSNFIDVTNDSTYYKQTHKTITRKVYAVNETGELILKDPILTQTATLTRTATLNTATKEVIYGNWNKLSFPEANLPKLAGYQDAGQVQAITLSDDRDLTENVTYYKNEDSTSKNSEQTNKNTVTMTVRFINNDGKIIKTISLSGKRNSIIDITNFVPENYKLDSNSATKIKLVKNKDSMDITVTRKGSNGDKINNDSKVSNESINKRNPSKNNSTSKIDNANSSVNKHNKRSTANKLSDHSAIASNKNKQQKVQVNTSTNHSLIKKLPKQISENTSITSILNANRSDSNLDKSTENNKRQQNQKIANKPINSAPTATSNKNQLTLEKTSLNSNRLPDTGIESKQNLLGIGISLVSLSAISSGFFYRKKKNIFR